MIPLTSHLSKSKFDLDLGSDPAGPWRCVGSIEDIAAPGYFLSLRRLPGYCFCLLRLRLFKPAAPTPRPHTPPTHPPTPRPHPCRGSALVLGHTSKVRVLASHFVVGKENRQNNPPRLNSWRGRGRGRGRWRGGERGGGVKAWEVYFVCSRFPRHVCARTLTLLVCCYLCKTDSTKS